jgi:hypothetical protein
VIIRLSPQCKRSFALLGVYPAWNGSSLHAISLGSGHKQAGYTAYTSRREMIWVLLSVQILIFKTAVYWVCLQAAITDVLFLLGFPDHPNAHSHLSVPYLISQLWHTWCTSGFNVGLVNNSSGGSSQQQSSLVDHWGTQYLSQLLWSVLQASWRFGWYSAHI